MYPSLSALSNNYSKRTRAEQAPDQTAEDELQLFELLSDDLKKVVLEHASRNPDCKQLGKWCTLQRCNEEIWQRACENRGWMRKPNEFTWRIWYARRCNPDWGHQMDEDLNKAIRNNDLENVRLLLDRGASMQGAVLFSASVKGYVDIVRLLLDRGLDINRDIDSFIYASREGRLEVVRLLINRGANIYARYGFALTLAAEFGQLEIVRLLLEHGAEANAGGPYDSLPLSMASHYGHLDIVRLLLQYGADVHAKDDEALREASENGHENVVQLLRMYMTDRGQ